MAPGGPAYSEVVQDDATASPTTSLSPAPSTSPMPLLPTAKSLTPLSMTSSDNGNVAPASPTKPAVGHGTSEPRSSHDADQPANPNLGAGASTKIYEPQARATTPNCPPTAPNSGPPEYELVAPGERQRPIPTETLPSLPPTTTTQPSIASFRHAAGSLANGDQEPALSTSSPSVQGNRLPPLDAGTAVAAAVAARARSSTTSSSIRQRLQSLSPESSDPLVLVRPQPILRTASTKSVSLRHPAPDITLPSARANNIAQLEATAERLSMTSSIDDAIRDLHNEQKRADSRRSSIRAASVGSFAESLEPPYSFSRQISGTSSILDINTAARQGGYSPAGYVMSPSNSIRSNTSRLRSGSTGLHWTTTADMEEATNPLSRHGPGKGSIHSVRSAGKHTLLTNIAEMEPTALTQEAMDAADQLPGLDMEDNTALQIPHPDASDRTPNALEYDNQQALDYWDQAVADSARQGHHDAHDDDNASLYAGSTGTFEQAELAFANFDGTHASPDLDHENMPFMPSFEQVQQHNRVSFMMPLDDEVEEAPDMAASEFPPRKSQPRASVVRPKSYLDPETGNTMLYYPARVPMMLNVPQKLSSKPKTNVRNKRRTQVLSDMADQNRQSGMTWLPELTNEPLMDTSFDHKDDEADSRGLPDTGFSDGALPSPRLDLSDEHESTLRKNPPTGNEEVRQSRIPPLNDVDKRKSRMSVMLPPQLRASAYFDLPSETTNLELKDGSATATLDDILNASASAPVSAFTDHAFAGSLGSEVYGTDKKRKSQMNRLSTATALDQPSRRSLMHLRKPSALSRHSKTAISQRSDSLENEDDRDQERTRLSGSAHRGHLDGEDSEGESDRERDEDEEEEEEEEEEENLYNGPPTTLLAELQIRKQQQKLRTRVAAQAYPNGMHSTLLEMDAVAEVERNARKGKKIALAWEAPKPGDGDESDDEDLPLGLLLATKSHGNLAAAVAELNRPMGLMEKREMEENEPLSQRRNRLLGPNAAPLRQTRSQMTLGHDRNGSGFLQPHSPRLELHTPEEDENEEETLGARKARLKAKADASLPEARPVSTAFSAELLDAFKGEETESNTKDKDGQPTEEEETLGQRRRRLQAEKEAREQEIGATGGMLGITSNDPAPMHMAKKHSMADVLGAYGTRVVANDPRTVAERMKQADGARYKQEQEQKLAAYRNQLPGNLSTPNLHTPGGFKSGRFNDGAGGGLGQPRASMVFPAVNEPKQPASNPYLMNAAAKSMNTFMQQPGFTPVQGYGGQPGYGAPGFGAPMMNTYGMPMQGQIGAPPMDRVEQWRQSVWQ